MKPRSKEPGNQNMVGAKIVKIRTSKNIKQKELLARLQVLGVSMTSSSLSRLEGQYRRACDYEILAVSEALNVNVYDLFKKD